VLEAVNNSVEFIDTPNFVPGVVLIRLKSEINIVKNDNGIGASDASLDETFQSLGIKSVEPVFRDVESSSRLSAQENHSEDLSHTYRLRFSPDTDVLQIVESLKKDPNVVYNDDLSDNTGDTA
jgi:hypothetical protein